jgi:hypothetical protein
MYRGIVTVLGVSDSNSVLRALARFISNVTDIFSGIGDRRDIGRGVSDTAGNHDTVNRNRGILALVLTVLGIGDGQKTASVRGRNITDNAFAVTENRHISRYERELRDSPCVGGLAGRITGYVRKQEETGAVLGEVKRMAGIFVRVVSGAMIRDYIVRRFLKAREELVLKSAVCREIELDSRVH